MNNEEIPDTLFGADGGDDNSAADGNGKAEKTVIVSNKPSVSTESDIISVMKSESGKVEKTDIKEYTVGALAAEMNLESHDEALKAQAVACYTYALYCKEKANKDDLNGADISDDSKNASRLSQQ